MLRPIFFFVCAASILPASGFASEWQNLERGLSYKKIEMKKRSSEVPYVLHAFKIDPQQFTFRVLTATPEKYSPVRRMVENSGAVMCINANFFDDQGKPLGLLIDQGRTLNSKKDISWWGIFYIEKGIPHIVHSTQWGQGRFISTAVQAGPRLVIKGIVPRLKSETSQKTAVGITKGGEVLLVVTLFPFEINELARLMARSEAKGGLGSVDALNLDGGSSTQMYARTGSFELRLPSYIGVPVGLGVFRKN